MERELSDNEVKKIQLGILDTVHNFCVQSGKINYFLAYGTLIGAIRHKGYIPWDDDIDIGMLREDYELFKATFNQSNSRYYLSDATIDPKHDRPFARIYDKNYVIYQNDKVVKQEDKPSPPFIDLFIMDNASDNDIEVKEQFEWRSKLRRFCKLKYGVPIVSNPNPIQRIKYTLLALPPVRFYLKMMMRKAQMFSHIETKRVGDFLGYYGYLAPKTIFDHYVDVEFEGKMYKAPAGYDELLTIIYGDYMTPPPPEKRQPKHSHWSVME